MAMNRSAVTEDSRGRTVSQLTASVSSPAIAKVASTGT